MTHGGSLYRVRTGFSRCRMTTVSRFYHCICITRRHRSQPSSPNTVKRRRWRAWMAWQTAKIGCHPRIYLRITSTGNLLFFTDRILQYRRDILHLVTSHDETLFLVTRASMRQQVRTSRRRTCLVETKWLTFGSLCDAEGKWTKSLHPLPSVWDDMANPRFQLSPWILLR